MRDVADTESSFLVAAIEAAQVRRVVRHTCSLL
jgi:hypothetical protein